MATVDWKSILDLPWIAWTIGSLIAAGGAFFVYRALFLDRSRGRRRCPKCWYDLRGTPGLRCPECGHESRFERHLHRTRRSWRWASFAALMILTGIFLTLLPSVRRDGWLSIVHTTALLLHCAPGWDSPQSPQDPVQQELIDRNATSELLGWQWSFVMDNLVELKHRRTWPASIPYVVELRTPKWVDRTAEATLRRASGFEQPADDNLALGERQFALGRVDPGAPLRFDCTFSSPSRGMPTSMRPGALTGPWKHTLTRELHVRLVDDIDEAITPLAGPEIDAAIRRAISLEIDEDTGCVRDDVQTTVMLRLNWADRLGSTVGLGFTLELHDAGGILDSAELQYSARRWFPTLGGYIDTSLRLTSTLKVDIDFFRSRSDWHFVLRGNPELALRDWNRSAYWAGQITLTPDDVQVKGRPPVEKAPTALAEHPKKRE